MDKRTLKKRILESLTSARDTANGSKASVREAHLPQRRLRRLSEASWLDAHGSDARRFFAEAKAVRPAAIQPRVVEVFANTPEAELFRAATSLWSVPVSRGYGRRMRFLVMDDANDKLIGLFALGDPVFNLKTRDEWIGWDVSARKERIASIMDLFVCGAVPPYTSLLGGKLVASLATSREVTERFAEKYKGRTGLISGVEKTARLLVITTTSALGRSSLYNRLTLHTDPPVRFTKIGSTKGWGHFPISDEVFIELRDLLAREGHPYANGYFFGTGPNWRLRTIRAGMQSLGLDQSLLAHGIQREVYASELVPSATRQLRTKISTRRVVRPSAAEISTAALERWIIPRYERSGILPWTQRDIDGMLSLDPD